MVAQPDRSDPFGSARAPIPQSLLSSRPVGGLWTASLVPEGEGISTSATILVPGRFGVRPNT